MVDKTIITPDDLDNSTIVASANKVSASATGVASAIAANSTATATLAAAISASGPGSGLTFVAHDATLTGDGTVAIPLSVVSATGSLKGIVDLGQDQVLGAGRKIVDNISGRYVAAASATLDTRTAEVFSRTITAATTFAFTNPNVAGVVTTFVLEITNGGAFTVTWPTSVKWDGGVKPELTASGLDILGFYTRDGGATWRGVMLAKDSK